ncbi:MAG: glycosyltransferase [Acidimicrobiales bacterium]
MIALALNVFMIAAFAFTILHFLAIAFWSLLSLRLLGRQRAARRPVPLLKTPTLENAPGVSVILPAYNEEAVIAHSVANALSQDYPKLEVIVVNDGSKDRTMEIMLEAFEMALVEENPPPGVIHTEEVFAIYRSQSDSRLWFVDKAPAGAKADNANVGLNLATQPFVVVMDADEFMETDCITRCMVEVMAQPDDVIAVGTTLLPANDIVIDGPKIVHRQASRNYWVGCQLIEYLTAFIISRPGMAHVGAMPIVSGGFGLFRREAVLKLGGYIHDHLGEDMDLCVRLHRYHLENKIPYRIIQAPEAVVWTEFPPVRSTLRRQRIRWHRGLRMIVADTRSLIGKPAYGNFGRFGVGTLFLFEWWGPIIEGLGYLVMLALLLLGWMNISAALALFLATQLIGQVVAILSVSIAVSTFGFYSRPRDLGYMLLWAIAMNWGFRQQSLFWRLRSLLPGETAWGEMPRAGFKTADTTV